MARCTARRSNGEPCRAYAIHGGTVCVTHGGAAPQVKRKAAEMLLALRDKAAATLDRQFDHDAVPPAVAHAVVRDMTETVAKMHDREAGAAAVSVVDDWLSSLKDES